ncbi:hypothetical protein GA0074692_5475 [Micromonospora pallida]|uniref:Uncharacterized protein n=1 Tax=Micromonospora pallida TaxID=145854 RepID=A0A1C6TE99_9ACTN|nr:hypothetical protein [Micromonospora pallida]SCL39765.1 hypothetical protein GA0074692_5475 [Micromonospora pallida]
MPGVVQPAVPDACGLAGTRFGLRPALLACAALAFTAALISPARSLRTLPKITEEGN